MEQPSDDRSLLATAAQHSDFAQSFVWQDYANEVRSWIEDVRNEYGNCKDMESVSHLNGVIEACRKFLELPEILMLAAEMEHERQSQSDWGGQNGRE